MLYKQGSIQNSVDQQTAAGPPAFGFRVPVKQSARRLRHHQSGSFNLVSDLLTQLSYLEFNRASGIGRPLAPAGLSQKGIVVKDSSPLSILTVLHSPSLGGDDVQIGSDENGWAAINRLVGSVEGPRDLSTNHLRYGLNRGKPPE